MEEPPGRHPYRTWIIVTFVVVAVITSIGYFYVLDSANSDAQSVPPTRFGDIHAFNAGGGLTFTASLLNVDVGAPSGGGTAKNQITIRLQNFFGSPNLNLADQNGQLKVPLTLVVYSGPGSATDPSASVQYLNFPVGQSFPDTDAIVNVDGRIAQYPFDKYTTSVGFSFLNATTHERIATVVNLSGGVHGYRFEPGPFFPPVCHGSTVDFTCRPGRKANAGFVALSVRRSSSTVFFAVFTMVFMWALALAGVAMALMLSLKQRDIGPGPLGYLAALLFAFPAIRNTLPGAPPIGAKFDYLAFFWTEAIVAVTLVVLGVLWIVREARSDGKSRELRLLEQLIRGQNEPAAPPPTA